MKTAVIIVIFVLFFITIALPAFISLVIDFITSAFDRRKLTSEEKFVRELIRQV